MVTEGCFSEPMPIADYGHRWHYETSRNLHVDCVESSLYGESTPLTIPRFNDIRHFHREHLPRNSLNRISS